MDCIRRNGGKQKEKRKKKKTRGDNRVTQQLHARFRVWSVCAAVDVDRETIGGPMPICEKT